MIWLFISLRKYRLPWKLIIWMPGRNCMQVKNFIILFYIFYTMHLTYLHNEFASQANVAKSAELAHRSLLIIMSRDDYAP